MNCLDWEERIALYAGGDLTGAEAAEVERHVADCAGCQVFWSGLRETLSELRESHAEEIAPAHFAAVRARVMGEIDRERKVWRRLAWVSGVGIAAAVILGLVLRPGPLPPPPARIAASIPAAPLRAATVSPPTRSRPRLARQARAGQPVLIKLQTADPNIVIYWIGENE
jgi:anti-sigma factor RsiW